MRKGRHQGAWGGWFCSVKERSGRLLLAAVPDAWAVSAGSSEMRMASSMVASSPSRPSPRRSRPRHSGLPDLAAPASRGVLLPLACWQSQEGLMATAGFLLGSPLP